MNCKKKLFGIVFLGDYTYVGKKNFQIWPQSIAKIINPPGPYALLLVSAFSAFNWVYSTLMKYIAGKLLDYDTFCQLHEDVLEWLLESEDKLKSMDSVSDNLDVARNQFEDNSEYMTELDIHQRAVGEVIKKGRHLF